jgi:hypothetical protein
MEQSLSENDADGTVSHDDGESGVETNREMGTCARNGFHPLGDRHGPLAANDESALLGLARLRWRTDEQPSPKTCSSPPDALAKSYYPAHFRGVQSNRRAGLFMSNRSMPKPLRTKKPRIDPIRGSFSLILTAFMAFSQVCREFLKDDPKSSGSQMPTASQVANSDSGSRTGSPAQGHP